VIGSRDLGEALARAAAFLRLVLPDLAVGIERDEHSARIEMREVIAVGSGRDDPRRVFAFEWLLRLVHGLSCWLVGRSLPLDSVQFPYDRPAHAADYALIYTEHPSFGGDRLVARLAAPMLTLPIRQDQESLARFLDGAPGKIVVLYRRDHEVVRQVRDLLAADLTGAPSLAQVARRLDLPLRTLQRRLKQEGSSFRAIKAGLRRNAALALVQHRDCPIAEVAQELGYAESSAFYRAFVHWTGEAPTHYRRKAQATT
jgi:AraC-like DNA-binding protein